MSTSSPIGVRPTRLRSSPEARIGRSLTRDHDVLRPQPRLLRRRALLDAQHDRAFGHRHAELLRRLRREVLRLDAEPPAPHLAEVQDLVDHRARHVGRHREADADVAARRPDDRGVDADQLAAQVDERAAGVAGVDRGVGLDELLVAVGADPAAPERADDAGGDRLPDAERVADRDHEVADVHRVRVAERGSRSGSRPGCAAARCRCRDPSRRTAP